LFLHIFLLPLLSLFLSLSLICLSISFYAILSFLTFPPCRKKVKVRVHHHNFTTNLLTKSRIKPARKQMAHICDMFVSQKFVAKQIS
jgi:hypothetical protein